MPEASEGVLPTVRGAPGDCGRVLVVAAGDVWPPTSGAAIRRALIVRSLARTRPTDLLLLGDRIVPPDLAAALGVEHVATCPVVRTEHRGRWLGRFDPYLYREAVTIAPAATAALARTRALPFADHAQVWFLREAAFRALGDEFSHVPRVIDLDESDHARFLHEARLAWAERPERGVRRAGARAARLAVAGARWLVLKRRCARHADAALVSSDADARRLRIDADVVPNCTLEPAGGVLATGPPLAERGPVVSFVGRLNYQPNVDGILWFAHDVLPHLRALVPDVRVRVAGRRDERLDEIAAFDGIEILGEIPDVGAELAGARCSIAPLRSGAGTRLKIVEAFSYGVPVVSTSIGADGLDVDPGRELLVADGPEAFARACAEVLRDDAVATALAEHGRQAHDARYGEGVARAAVARVLARLDWAVPQRAGSRPPAAIQRVNTASPSAGL